MDTLMPIVVMGGLTLIVSSLLVAANHWLHVEEDPRVAAVEAMLPLTNCGGCGYPGCRPFAEALVAGEVLPGQCTVSSPADQQRIGAFLGVSAGTQEPRIARLACAGGTNVSRRHAHYVGISSCAAASLVAGGGQGCFWGCLGDGDCAEACTFDAIRMNEQGLPVVDEPKCTGCGDCVTACPKDLFSLVPQSQRLWVACRSLAAGDELLEDCEVACTACGRCARDTPELITMSHCLPIINDPHRRATPEAIQSCPTGAIVWFNAAGQAEKGRSAHKVIRKGEVHDAAT